MWCHALFSYLNVGADFNRHLPAVSRRLRCLIRLIRYINLRYTGKESNQ